VGAAARMNRIATILLGLLAIAAITFLAIYEPLTNSTRENRAALRDGLVFHLDPAKVRVIRITTGDRDLEIKRRGNSWQLGMKSKDRADAALVDQLLNAASGLHFFDRIAGREFQKDDDWSDYGLRKPKRKIEFEGDGKTTLFLGKDGANENRVYVRSSESRDVYLVSDDILRTGFRDEAAFRDRRLTDLGPGQIDRVIIRREGGEIELLRDAIGWQIVKPLHARADDKKVAEYLGRLLGLRIIDFVADDTGDLGAYGMVEGKDEITFFAEGNERHQTLRLGRGKSGDLFGQFTARDSVYSMPAEASDLLLVKPDALRDRHLLTLNPDIVDLIRLRAPGKEFSLRRSPAGWEVRDNETSRPASEAAVRALWDAIATTEVSAYLPATGVKLSDFGLDPPLCSVDFVSVLSENTPEATAGEQVIASVSFGKNKKGELTARLNDSPELATVPESILSALPLDPAAWLSPR